MTSVDSAFAGSMNAHVLTTIASASSASGTSSQPAAPSLPIITSESTRFFAQPSETNETRWPRVCPSTGSGQAVGTLMVTLVVLPRSAVVRELQRQLVGQAGQERLYFLQIILGFA